MSDVVSTYVVAYVLTDFEETPVRKFARMTAEEAAVVKEILTRYESESLIREPECFIPDPKQDFDDLVDELLSGIVHTTRSGESKCQNCERVWPDELLTTPIPDIEQRVAPGERMPSGECPACFAVCHPVKVPA